MLDFPYNHKRFFDVKDSLRPWALSYRLGHVPQVHAEIPFWKESSTAYETAAQEEEGGLLIPAIRKTEFDLESETRCLWSC